MRRDYQCPKLVLPVMNGVLWEVTIDSKGSLSEFLVKFGRFLSFGRVVHHSTRACSSPLLMS
jgi:hypothetical protein